MKKYWIAEYSIKEYEELKLMYKMLMRIKELDTIDNSNIYTKKVINIAREWIGTTNALTFGQYSVDDIVVIEFDHKPVEGVFLETKVDDFGVYIEV